MSYVQIYPKGKKLNNEAYRMPWRSDAVCYNFNEPEDFIPDEAIEEMITDAMIRAIIIYANGEYEVADIKTGHRSLELIVGGDIEGLTFAGHSDFIMFLNETGKIMGLPVNSKATIFSLEFTEKIDLIRGDIVICGIDKEGDSCDLSNEQITGFMKILDGIN